MMRVQKCSYCPCRIRQGFPVKIRDKWALLCGSCAAKLGYVKPS